MPKIALYGEAARARFLDGIDCLADLTATTLGPLGRNVLVDGGGAAPFVAGSGRDLARHVEVADPFANLGVCALRDAASNVFSAAGDGTSTTILLARRMIHAALASLRAGVPAPVLRAQMIEATVAVVEELGRRARPCDERALRGVARSAASGDDEIAEQIVAAIDAAGDVAGVEVLAGSGTGDELDVTRGHELTQGFHSVSFPVEDGARAIALDRPLVFVCEAPLTRVEDVERALSFAHRAGRALFVVAADVASDALRTIALNHAAGRVHGACVRPPLSGDDGRAFLHDIAVLTGAQLLPNPSLLRDAGDFGVAERIDVEGDKTVLVGPGGESASLDAHKRALRRMLDAGDSSTRSPTSQAHARHVLEQRLRTLEGAGCRVRVGGRTDIELRARLGRYEAARAALEGALAEGIVAGGGAALVHASRALGDSPGAQVVAASACEPMRVILASAGLASAHPQIHLSGDASASTGFDARTREFGDLFTAGVVDPVRVVRLALQTAAGVATTVMDTAAMLARGRDTAHALPFDPSVAAATREDCWRPDRPAAPPPTSSGPRNAPVLHPRASSPRARRGVT